MNYEAIRMHISFIRILVCLVLCTICTSSNVAGPAIFTGEEWVSVSESNTVDINKPSQTVDVSKSDIFVGILNYRDPRCGQTLHNLFSKAEHPERVHIGLVQHRSSTDAECINSYCKLHGANHFNMFGSKCPYVSQITTISTSQYEAKSPSRGKHLVYQLLKDEEFCLTAEVNVDVIKHWDSELINMWTAANNENAILSTFPPITVSTIQDVLDYSVKNQHEVPHLCRAGYFAGMKPNIDHSYSDAQAVVENLPPRSAVNLGRPLLTSLYSSTFAFNKCHAERKVGGWGLQLMCLQLVCVHCHCMTVVCSYCWCV